MNSLNDAKSVSIYIDGTILKRLDDLCRIFNVNRSKFINEILDEKLSWYEESMRIFDEGGHNE